METKLLKTEEVAEILQVSRPRAYELIRQGLLPATRLGRQVRVDPRRLEEFIDGGGKALDGGWRRVPAT